MTSRIMHELTFHEMARRLLLKQSAEQISQAMGIKLDIVKRTLRKKEFKKVAMDLQEATYRGLDQELKDDARDLRSEIQEAAFDSFDRLKELLHYGAGEAVVTNIAHDFLDRAGYGKQKSDAPAVNIIVNPIDADILATALDTERKGRERLEKKGDLNLAKLPEDLNHPLTKDDEDSDTKSTK